MNLQSLKRKVGPLPIWAWALIVSFLLFVLYHYFRNRSSSNTSPATQQQQPDGTSTPVDNSGTGAGGFGTPLDTQQPTSDLSSLLPWLALMGLAGGEQPQQPLLDQGVPTDFSSSEPALTPLYSPFSDTIFTPVNTSSGVQYLAPAGGQVGIGGMGPAGGTGSGVTGSQGVVIPARPTINNYSAPAVAPQAAPKTVKQPPTPISKVAGKGGAPGGRGHIT